MTSSNPQNLNDPKTAALYEIKKVLLDASNAPLFEYRQANKYWPVIGEGSHETKIMFVGEAPGKNEALTGRPFCGAAGKVLDELLESVGLKREEIYITNIVKDRPPENRDPLPEEIAYYAPFLDRQIEILEPRVIATLGRFSMMYILNKYFLPAGTITEMHGRVIETEEKYGPLVIIPLYHPAASIYNQKLKETLKKDFALLSKFK
jgi:DNA polymerase